MCHGSDPIISLKYIYMYMSDEHYYIEGTHGYPRSNKGLKKNFELFFQKPNFFTSKINFFVKKYNYFLITMFFKIHGQNWALELVLPKISVF